MLVPHNKCMYIHKLQDENDDMLEKERVPGIYVYVYELKFAELYIITG